MTGENANQPDLDALTAHFRTRDAVAVALMGSYARGDAGRFSDVDLVRFYAGGDGYGGAETRFLDGFFIVVSDVRPAQVEDWFYKPDQASATIAGLRSARPLWDPAGFFTSIQSEAKVFTWDSEMQARADAWASSQMAGWIEEAQKGLAGLRASHEGRLLNARYGLTWGMLNVLRVQRGILISGDNGTYPEVIQNIGPGSRWAVLSRQAFGIDGAASLTGQVTAGLRLYIHTAELLAGILKPDDKRSVNEVVRRIMAELPGEPDLAAG